MARSSNILWNVVLPLVIFLPLSVTAIKLLFGHLRQAGLIKVDELCPLPFEGKPPFQLKYLGGYLPSVEHQLCVLVGFFHPLFQETTVHAPFIRDFLVSFAACVVIPLFEASRTNRPFLLGFPLIVGAIYQNVSAGATYPVYWALFLAITRDRAAGSQISQARAEAILFGLVMGFALPTVAMVYMGAPEPIALWQAFPLIISVFQALHLFFRPSRSHNGSGYRTVQATYIVVFIVSSIVHFYTLSAYKFDRQTILEAFIPSLVAPDARKGHTAQTSSLHFLQWDFVFIFGSTFLASLWFARSVAQGVSLLVWIAASSVVLGPGAAVSGIFFWREARLNQERLRLPPPLKRAKAQ